jgi:hypothetical protein
VAPGTQLAAKFFVVVDLPVAYDSDRAVLVENWLVPARDVDDRQPLHADGQAVLGVDTSGVRASVHEDIAHGRQDRGVEGTTKIAEAGNPAHQTGVIGFSLVVG